MAAKATEGKVTDLIPDDRNANRHSERGIELVDKSFKELGAGRSVVVDRHNKLIAGNNSQRAASEAGITKTVVVETDGDTLVVVKRTDLDLDSTDDPRARQMALIDNSSALLGIQFDFDVAQEIGNDFDFDVSEWGVEIPEEVIAPEAEEDGGAPPLPSFPVTVKGDIWELISDEKKLRHRVMCGDSTSVDDWDKLIEKKQCDLLVTDPPYGVAYVGSTKDKLTIQNDALTAEETHQLWNDALTAALLMLKDGAGIYATVPAGLLQFGFMQVMQDHECLRQCMVWDKGQLVMGYSDYQYAHEPILYGWKPGGAHYFTDDRTKTTVFRFPKPTRSELHPTMKPIDLWAEMIGNSSKPKQTVIDTFLGSGTTLIACEQLNRNCYGMELDEKYCDVIVRRWVAQMEKDGKKYTILLNGQPAPDKVEQLFKQGGNAANEEEE